MEGEKTKGNISDYISDTIAASLLMTEYQIDCISKQKKNIFWGSRFILRWEGNAA